MRVFFGIQSLLSGIRAGTSCRENGGSPVPGPADVLRLLSRLGTRDHAARRRGHAITAIAAPGPEAIGILGRQAARRRGPRTDRRQRWQGRRLLVRPDAAARQRAGARFLVRGGRRGESCPTSVRQRRRLTTAAVG